MKEEHNVIYRRLRCLFFFSQLGDKQSGKHCVSTNMKQQSLFGYSAQKMYNNNEIAGRKEGRKEGRNKAKKKKISEKRAWCPPWLPFATALFFKGTQNVIIGMSHILSFLHEY